MGVKERIAGQLKMAREVTESMLAAFKTPRQWTHQVHPHTNHALWFAGHMAVTDNFFISLAAPDSSRELDGYQEKFGMGSQPTGDPADYPPPEEVLEVMRERRAKLHEVLDGFDDDDLAKPTPAGAPDFLPDIAKVFETAAWHEGLHAGQVSVVRRSLGNAPLYAPPEAAQA